MFEEVNLEDLEKKKNIKYSKPDAFEGRKYPLEKLTDVEFEILTYYLYENNSIKKEKYGYDRAIYVEGGTDRGQDLVLKKNGKISGIVQCKHSQNKTKHGKKTVADELLKILLYMIMYPNEITSERINYMLVISSSFTKNGRDYIENMSNYFIIENEELKDEVQRIISEYKTFTNFFKESNLNILIQDILKNFKKIDFFYEEEQDILLELSRENKGIRNIFFNIRTVVEVLDFPEFEGETNEEILNRKKEEYISEKFCRELIKIDASGRNIEKAIIHFYKKQCIVGELSTRGIIRLQTHLEYFENNILELEESEREIFLLDNKNKSEYKTISYEYYLKFLNMIIKHSMKIRQLGEVTMDFKCGTIQDLVNESKIKKWYLGDDE